MKTTGAVLLAGVMMSAAACQLFQAPGDKAGNQTVLLRLATIDAVDNNGMSYGPVAFVEALEEVSDGKLRVEVDTETFGDGSPGAESRLVRAIATGRVDGGWPSTRAFARAGIDGLEVVETPLALTSYAAVGELVTAPVADALLGRLDGTGVVGLGLAVGPLRRPFASVPLLEPKDWRRRNFRSFNSPVQEAAIRALGAAPVRIGEAWPDRLRNGSLHGLEFDVAQYHTNGMTTQAPHLTSNVVLWPKVFVLSLSQERFDSLSPHQRAWVHEAAAAATRASVEATYGESLVVRQLCAQGVRLHEATPVQLARMRDAVAPVVSELADDGLLDDILDIAAAHPRADVLDPDDCRPRPRVRTTTFDEIPDTAAGIPDGVYRAEITQEDLDASMLGPATEGFGGVWTMTIERGRFQIDCSPAGRSTGVDCNYAETTPADFDYNPREVGGLYGFGDIAFFRHEPRTEARLTDCLFPPSETDELSCMPVVTNRVRWRLDDDTLTMTNLVTDSASYQLVLEPWRKIK